MFFEFVIFCVFCGCVVGVDLGVCFLFGCFSVDCIDLVKLRLKCIKNCFVVDCEWLCGGCDCVGLKLFNDFVEELF